MKNNSINLTSPGRAFTIYVSQNILGSLGISAYVLADAFFISRATGPDGITALNLVLPVYSLIFAIGAMIGTGSATRFRIADAQKSADRDLYFFQAIAFCILIGGVFMAVGIFAPAALLRLLGADDRILQVGTRYTRIFLLFAPLFMLNYVTNAFTRNDNAPTVAMTATFSSSIFNIVMDYLLVFPLGLGIDGAALATALSPIVGIMICCCHFFSRNNTVRLLRKPFSIDILCKSCQLGVSAFISELAGGVTTMVFNLLILSLAGNIGVAAYGVIANAAIVPVAVFSGIVQGAQPLLSYYYGKGMKREINRVRGLSFGLAFLLGAVFLGAAQVLAPAVTGVFNSSRNTVLEEYAVKGMRIYFSGYLFSGISMVGIGYFSAVAEAGRAFALSILRGFVAIILMAVLLSKLFGLTGVWASFPAAEGLTLMVFAGILMKDQKRKST